MIGEFMLLVSNSSSINDIISGINPFGCNKKICLVFVYHYRNQKIKTNLHNQAPYSYMSQFQASIHVKRTIFQKGK
jgi:hypothetical protein